MNEDKGTFSNYLIIHTETEVGKEIFLDESDCELSLATIDSEKVVSKQVSDGVNVYLKAGNVIYIAEWFVDGDVICINDQ